MRDVFKQQLDEARKVIELNNVRVKKMIADNQIRIDEIQEGEETKMTKGIGTKKLVIVCAVLAGVAFVAGRKEGYQLGYEESKELHSNRGYTKAIGDIINKLGK